MGVLDFLSKLQSVGAPSSKNLPAAGSSAAAVNAPVAAVIPAANLPASAEELPAKIRATAMERLMFVRLTLARKAASGCTDREAAEYVAANHVQEFPILRVAGHGGATALHYNNFRNWRARIKGISTEDSILRALCDNYTRGIKPRHGDQRFWEIFFAMFLNLNHLPVTVAYKRACQRMRQEAKDIPVPSLRQARYQVDHLAPDTVILAREGEEAWRNKCCDFIRRDWLEVSPGECIIGDSRTFDTRVRVWNNDQQKWQAVRPTIAALMDGRSWYIPAYWITAEPVNCQTLIDTLRLYLRATGGIPPAIVYFDNGKDYCAQGFATDFEAEGYQHSIFRELGIRLLNSLAYNARAKTIERAFRDMMQQFDKMFPDYLGSRPGQRNQAADYYDNHPEELPSLDQFCQIFASWLNEYHNTPKGGSIHRGRSPREIWESGSRAGRVPLSPERLKMAFLKPEAVRTVGRGPSVKWDNELYYSDSLKWGTRVLIKSDTLDRDHVMCYTIDGAFIAEARTRASIHALAGSEDDIKALMRRQRHQLKEARTCLDSLTGGKHLYSPLELLLADPDAVGITAGEISSVKGAAHHYEHHSLPGVIDPAVLPEPEQEQDRIPAEEYDPEIAEAASSILQKTIPEEHEDDLSDIHNFITTHKKEEGDEE